MNEFPKQNTGILEGKRPTDYMAGALTYEVRNPSGDWRDFLPKYEKQRDPLETMACVTFSNLSGCEIQTIHQTGAEINYSDRFTAKMSNTTKEGNYQWAVADSIRLHGVVLEEKYQNPKTSLWDTYYTSIPQDVINSAIKLDYAYEFLPIRQTALDKQTLAYHLKHAPIQVIVPAPYPNHAVMALHIEGDTVHYLDTYSPFLKKMHYSNITSALKGVLTIKKNNMFLANDKGVVYMVSGNTHIRKRGIADIETLGLYGDEPQVPMDTSHIPMYQIEKKNPSGKGFIIVDK